MTETFLAPLYQLLLRGSTIARPFFEPAWSSSIALHCHGPGMTGRIKACPGEKCSLPTAHVDANADKPDHDGTSMAVRQWQRRLVLVSQRPIQLAPGRFDRTARRIQRVAHTLPGAVEIFARPLARAFLVTGGQARQRQRAGGDQQRNTHRNLLCGEDRRNDIGRPGFHRGGHVRVGAA